MDNKIWLKLNFILIFLLIKIYGETEVVAENLFRNLFCTQYNDTQLYYDKAKLESLIKNQYVLKESEYKTNIYFTDRLDYYIRFLLQAEGLCFNDSNDIHELDKIPNEISVKENEAVLYTSKIRYAKTVSCFQYYYENMQNDKKDEFVNKHKLCRNHCIIYYYLMEGILFDPIICPFPKNYETTPLPPNVNSDQEITNRRIDFLNNIAMLCNNENLVDTASNSDSCKDEKNLEIANCGFSSQEDKKSFCNINENPYPAQPAIFSKDCCSLKYETQIFLKTRISNYEIYRIAVIIGSSVGGLLLIIGMYFSTKYIKEIKVQESITKSVRHQEKEYQEANKKLMKNAYEHGFNPNEQTYNSSSRNLNSGTLRNPRPMNTLNSYASSSRGNTMNSYSSSSRGGTIRSGNGMNGNTLNGNSMNGSLMYNYNSSNRGPTKGRNTGSTGRYPPNSFKVSQDYQSTDSRDISLRRGMIVQLVQRYEGGWVLVRDINTNRQGYAPEYCLESKMA